MEYRKACGKYVSLTFVVVCSAVLLAAQDSALAPPSLSTLASFTFTNGAMPACGFISDGVGDLFGTTASGGISARASFLN